MSTDLIGRYFCVKFKLIDTENANDQSVSQIHHERSQNRTCKAKWSIGFYSFEVCILSAFLWSAFNYLKLMEKNQTFTVQCINWYCGLKLVAARFYLMWVQSVNL